MLSSLFTTSIENSFLYIVKWSLENRLGMWQPESGPWYLAYSLGTEAEYLIFVGLTFVTSSLNYSPFQTLGI